MSLQEQFTPIPLSQLIAKDFSTRRDSWSYVYERLFESQNAETPAFLFSLYAENRSDRQILSMHLKDIPEQSLPLSTKKTYFPRVDVNFHYNWVQKLVTGLDYARVWLRDLNDKRPKHDAYWCYYLVYVADRSLEPGLGKLDEIRLYTDGATLGLVDKVVRKPGESLVDSSEYRRMSDQAQVIMPDIVDWKKVLTVYSESPPKVLTAEKIFANPLDPLFASNPS